MAAASNWAPAHVVRLTWNTKILNCTTLTHRKASEQFETTNTESDGDYEFGIGGRRRDLRFSLPVDLDSADHVPDDEALVDAVFRSYGHTYTGKARITSVEQAGGGKGGLMYNYEATFTGTVTKALIS